MSVLRNKRATGRKDKKPKQNSGFTLIEMALLLIIMGVLTLPLLNVYRAYSLMNDQKITQERLEKISEALTEFAANNGFYPCPAGRDTARDHANYGRSLCPPAIDPIPGACQQGVCQTIGRDADMDGDGDPALIGMVPFRVINEGEILTILPDGRVIYSIEPNEYTLLSAQDIVDGWNNRIIYAVTQNLTSTNTYDDSLGAIEVIDENDRSIVTPEGSAHVALLSHGPNAMGAFSRSGTQITECSLGMTETLNCAYDLTSVFAEPPARFIAGIRRMAEGNSYYDDQVKYITMKISSPWIYGFNGNIYNTNIGNIGVGLDDPQARLDVDGNIKSLRLHTPEICDKQGEDCFNPELIGGDMSQMQCSTPGHAAVGIANGQIICEPVFSGVTGSCPPGEYITGVSNLGNVVCQTF